MKVFLLNILYPPDGIGGSEQSVQYLARGLHALGHEVHVISQALSESTVCEDDNGVKVTRLGMPPGYQPNVLARPREEMLALRSLQQNAEFFGDKVGRLIAKERPAVVHSNVVARIPDIWSHCKSHRVALVQTLRSYSIMCTSRMLVGGRPCGSWCAGCQKEYFRRLNSSAKVTAVVGISEHILQTYLQQGFFPGPCLSEVIPNSYEAKSISPLPVVLSGGKEVVLGYLGRIHESKGIETILKGFSDFGSRKMVLKIAGSGNSDYIEYLKRNFAGPLVDFVGYVDPQEFINTLDVLCVPSLWHEPFGRVNMEALAHGRAVIGARRGGIPEIIENQKTGWIYEPYSDGQFRAILEKISGLSNREWKSIHRNCMIAAKRYGVETIARQYENLYYRSIEMV